MPLLGTRGAASARGFGFAGIKQTPFWIGMFGDSGSDTLYGITADSENNLYAVGEIDGKGQIVKYNASGVIQWQRSLTVSGYYAVAVDTVNDVYVTGSNSGMQLTKYNSSGVLQFQKKLGSAANNERGWGIAGDSSNNMYIVGYDQFNGNSIRVVKYNSSGTLQWQRRLDSFGGLDEQAYGVVVDSSSNVYIVGYSDQSSPIKIQVAKYNSSGTIQWQRQTNFGSDPATGIGIAIDSSSNIYAACNLFVSGVNGLGLVKYDSSGTLQWARRLSGNGQSNCRAVTVDSGDNIYIAGFSGDQGNNDSQWAKYNSSGTLQWQRRLTTSSNDEGWYGIKADSIKGIFIGGYTGASTGNRNFLLSRLPQDGSKTGTYTVGGESFTYASSSLTGTSPSLTNSASNLTDSATTSSETTTTATDAATNLTSTVTTI